MAAPDARQRDAGECLIEDQVDVVPPVAQDGDGSRDRQEAADHQSLCQQQVTG